MKHTSLASRSLSLGLACLFAANVALAHVPESNFWRDRRNAVIENGRASLQPSGAQSGGDAFQLASLPALPHSAGGAFLKGGLPTLQPHAAGDLSLVPSLKLHDSARIKNLKGRVSDRSFRKLSEAVSSLPAAYGSVRNISAPTGASSGKIIIHVQDVHQNREAQANIGHAVEQLITDKRIDLIALEGAFADIELEPFQKYPRQNTVRRIADYLLRESQISGPIHAALTSGTDTPPIVGVDHQPYYEANVAAYKASRPRLKEAKQWLSKWDRDISSKRSQVLNPALLDFDDRVEAYHAGRIPISEHLEFLAAPPREVSLELESFREALKMEASLDTRQIEDERTRLLTRLIKNLRAEESAQLINLSVATRLGQIRHSDFYASLQMIARKNGVNLADYPAMDAYIRYVLLTDSLDGEKIFLGIKLQEESGYKELAKSEEEKHLIQEISHSRFTGKLLDFSLTSDEWRDYKRLQKHNSRPPLLTHFEAFYYEAEKRDRAMAVHLGKTMEETGAKTALLVTGGFHAHGINSFLEENGMSVLSFVPNITKIDLDSVSSYLSVFAQEKTPLQKLFEGQKLFLATPPSLPTPQLGLMIPAEEARQAGPGAEAAFITSARDLPDIFSRIPILKKLKRRGPTFEATVSSIKPPIKIRIESTSLDRIDRIDMNAVGKRKRGQISVIQLTRQSIEKLKNGDLTPSLLAAKEIKRLARFLNLHKNFLFDHTFPIDSDEFRERMLAVQIACLQLARDGALAPAYITSFYFKKERFLTWARPEHVELFGAIEATLIKNELNKPYAALSHLVVAPDKIALRPDLIEALGRARALIDGQSRLVSREPTSQVLSIREASRSTAATAVPTVSALMDEIAARYRDRMWTGPYSAEDVAPTASLDERARAFLLTLRVLPRLPSQAQKALKINQGATLFEDILALDDFIRQDPHKKALETFLQIEGEILRRLRYVGQVGDLRTLAHYQNQLALLYSNFGFKIFPLLKSLMDPDAAAMERFLHATENLTPASAARLGLILKDSSLNPTEMRVILENIAALDVIRPRQISGFLTNWQGATPAQIYRDSSRVILSVFLAPLLENPADIPPSVMEAFPPMYAARLLPATQFLESERPTHIDLFFGLLTSMLQENTARFITDTRQPHPLGREIAQFNENLRRELARHGVSPENWLRLSTSLSKGKKFSVITEEGTLSGGEAGRRLELLNQLCGILLRPDFKSGHRTAFKNALRKIGLKLEDQKTDGLYLTPLKEKPEAGSPRTHIIRILSKPGVFKKLAPSLKFLHNRSGVHSADLSPILLHLMFLLDSPAPAVTPTKKPRHYQLTVQSWDPTSPRAFFIGDQVRCCLASNSGEHFEGILELMIDQGTHTLEVIDNDTGETVAAAFLYLAIDETNTVHLVIDSLELRGSYGSASEPMKRHLINETIAIAKSLGLARVSSGPSLYSPIQLSDYPLTQTKLKKIGGYFRAIPYHFESIKPEDQLTEDERKNGTVRTIWRGEEREIPEMVPDPRDLASDDGGRPAGMLAVWKKVKVGSLWGRLPSLDPATNSAAPFWIGLIEAGISQLFTLGLAFGIWAQAPPMGVADGLVTVLSSPMFWGVLIPAAFVVSYLAHLFLGSMNTRGATVTWKAHGIFPAAKAAFLSSVIAATGFLPVLGLALHPFINNLPIARQRKLSNRALALRVARAEIQARLPDFKEEVEFAIANDQVEKAARLLKKMGDFDIEIEKGESLSGGERRAGEKPLYVARVVLPVYVPRSPIERVVSFHKVWAYEAFRRWTPHLSGRERREVRNALVRYLGTLSVKPVVPEILARQGSRFLPVIENNLLSLSKSSLRFMARGASFKGRRTRVSNIETLADVLVSQDTPGLMHGGMEDVLIRMGKGPMDGRAWDAALTDLLNAETESRRAFNDLWFRNEHNYALEPQYPVMVEKMRPQILARIHAARYAGELGKMSPELTRALNGMLESFFYRERLVAAWALIKSGNRQELERIYPGKDAVRILYGYVVSAFLNFYYKREDKSVLEGALNIFRDLGPAGYPALIAALFDYEPAVSQGSYHVFNTLFRVQAEDPKIRWALGWHEKRRLWERNLRRDKPGSLGFKETLPFPEDLQARPGAFVVDDYPLIVKLGEMLIHGENDPKIQEQVANHLAAFGLRGAVAIDQIKKALASSSMKDRSVRKALARALLRIQRGVWRYNPGRLLDGVAQGDQALSLHAVGLRRIPLSRVDRRLRGVFDTLRKLGFDDLVVTGEGARLAVFGQALPDELEMSVVMDLDDGFVTKDQAVHALQRWKSFVRALGQDEDALRVRVNGVKLNYKGPISEDDTRGVIVDRSYKHAFSPVGLNAYGRLHGPVGDLLMTGTLPLKDAFKQIQSGISQVVGMDKAPQKQSGDAPGLGHPGIIERLMSIIPTSQPPKKCLICNEAQCSTQCPVRVPIPALAKLIQDGDFKGAFDLLMKVNPLAPATCKVCPHECHKGCVLLLRGSPVGGEGVEGVLVEDAIQNKYIPQIPLESPGLGKVAVVGSGPAGLMAAWQLIQKGYAVTVYEAKEELGGLMRYAIPKERLPRENIDLIIQFLKNHGVNFVADHPILEEGAVSKILDQYDAVCLACGPGVARDLNVPGREKFKRDILHAEDVLWWTKLREAEGHDPEDRKVFFKGKKVVVIGGGKTGEDCRTAASDEGAASVTVVEYLPRFPSLARQTQPYQVFQEIQEKQNERVREFFAARVTGFEGVADEDGATKLTGLRWNEINLLERDEDGNFVVEMSEEKLLEADVVILAIGFDTRVHDDLLHNFGFARDASGRMARRAMIPFENKRVPVILSGDMNTGPSLIISAAQDGARAADEIHGHLSKDKEKVGGFPFQNLLTPGVVMLAAVIIGLVQQGWVSPETFQGWLPVAMGVAGLATAGVVVRAGSRWNGVLNRIYRHPGESRDPVRKPDFDRHFKTWMPVRHRTDPPRRTFAGMTSSPTESFQLNRLFPKRRLHRVASLLVAMAGMSADVKGMEADKIVEMFFAGSALSVGASTLGSKSPSGKGTLPEDWRDIVSDARFPSILKAHVDQKLQHGLEPDAALALVEALYGFGFKDALQDFQFDVVIRIKNGEDLSKAKTIWTRAQSANSVTFLVESVAEEKRVRLANVAWMRAGSETNRSLAAVHVYEDGLFVDQTIVLKNLRKNLPGFLKADPSNPGEDRPLDNVLLVTFERMELDTSGIKEESDLTRLKLMVWDRLNHGLIATIQDHLLIKKLAHSLLTNRQA